MTLNEATDRIAELAEQARAKAGVLRVAAEDRDDGEAIELNVRSAEQAGEACGLIAALELLAQVES